MNETVEAPVQKTEINGREDKLRVTTQYNLPPKVDTNFAFKRRPLDLYSSLED
jgi:hypothetical protein